MNRKKIDCIRIMLQCKRVENDFLNECTVFFDTQK